MTQQALTDDDAWVRGEDTEFSLAITDRAGNPEDLTDALVELEIKKSDGDPDPATLHLDTLTDGGLTLQDQTSDPGLCFGLATAAQTSAIPAGTWHFDVFVTLPGSPALRKRAIFGTISFIDTPNQP